MTDFEIWTNSNNNIRKAFWVKINKLIDEVNLNINSLLNEWKIEYLEKTFNKLIRLLNVKIRKWLSEKDLEEILLFIWHIFELFDIKKIYNLDSIKKLSYFSQLSLEDMFSQNILPSNWSHTNWAIIPWWTCNSWTIFFYKLMSLFQNIIEKKSLLKYWWEYRHSSLYVTINWKDYLIDPFAKSPNIIKEIKVWWDIYIWTSFNKPIFWKIKSIESFVIEINWVDINCTHFDNIDDFINSLNPPENLITQVRTYKDWKKIDLIIKKTLDWSWYILQFENIQEQWYLWILKIDLEEISKRKEFSSYDLLLAFFQNDSLNNEDKENLKYISILVDKDILLSKLI